jgi:regulatory protein YycI of two-component signal transduction system YycFG
MAAKTPEDRLDRLEAIVQVIAEDQVSLQKIVADLATETRKGFDLVARQSAESDRRIAKLEDQMRETDERGRRLDERIDKLVSAMGEYIRRSN